MSLLHPTPGSVMDRLGILDLKIAAYRSAQRDPLQLLNERYELRSYLSLYHRSEMIDGESWREKESTINVLRSDLDGVNKELWHCEDEIRAFTGVMEIAKVGKRIPILNDRRTSLIREIDRTWECSEVTEEKIFNVGH